MFLIKGMDSLPEKELNRPELFSLEQNYIDDHIINDYKIINNTEKVNRNQLFTLSASTRSWSHYMKLVRAETKRRKETKAAFLKADWNAPYQQKQRWLITELRRLAFAFHTIRHWSYMINWKRPKGLRQPRYRKKTSSLQVKWIL